MTRDLLYVLVAAAALVVAALTVLHYARVSPHRDERYQPIQRTTEEPK